MSRVVERYGELTLLEDDLSASNDMDPPRIRFGVEDRPKKRRRYDAVNMPHKVLEDVRVYVAAHPQRKGLPGPLELYAEGYHSLAFAVRALGYHNVVRSAEVNADPQYFFKPCNLREEIRNLTKTDVHEPKAVPSYRELAGYPQLLDGLRHVGGIARVFPPGSDSITVTLDYYDDDENLRVEVDIWMAKLVTACMPTYAQVAGMNDLITDTYLRRRGYLRTAKRLGLKADRKYLDVTENLRFELKLIHLYRGHSRSYRPSEAALRGHRCMMPTEREILEGHRLDLHHAVQKLGGYLAASELLGFWLRPTYWKANPSGM